MQLCGFFMEASMCDQCHANGSDVHRTQKTEAQINF
jgi:hypothetical protein